jgi:predicted esterase
MRFIMNIQRTISASGCCLFLTTIVTAQNYDLPPTKMPDEKTMELIQHRLIKLREAVEKLPASLPEHIRADVEIYLKAADWMVRYKEYYHADAAKWTLTTLEQGLQRAAEAAAGKAAWTDGKARMTARGYVSKIDGSVQPFAVAYPSGYADDPTKKWRLDIHLHGRDGSISEAKFLAQHTSAKTTSKDQDFVFIDIYGRGNNAYRWAGETDVYEVLQHFLQSEKERGRADRIDLRRIVLRGYSMGGAGTWHLGLHRPDRFCVIGPGAGFATTHGYIKGLPNTLPSYQESCLHIYDAVDYAENAFDVPIVAYNGELDAQKAAADKIEAKLKKLKIASMTHLIAPGLKHESPSGEWAKKASIEYAKYAGEGKGRSPYPEHIRFVTFTLKFNRSDWVEILGFDKHYEEAKVDAKWDGSAFKVETKNVRILRLSAPPDKPFPATLTIDSQQLTLNFDRRPRSMTFRKEKDQWQPDNGNRSGLEKIPNLQGPIDDAFTSGFICVKSTSPGLHPLTSQSATAQFTRFEREWEKWMRGKLPVKTAEQITNEDLSTKNLILFGDPASNPLIAKVIDKLPLQWTKDQIVFGDKNYDAAKHLPVLIYPNPLNPRKYVVLNSGHTFHDAEFRDTNAQLYPRLGDYAIIAPAPTEKEPAAFEVIFAGLFDDFWKK